MQSLRQYRKIGNIVREQLSRDQEKARALANYTRHHGVRGEEPADVRQQLERAESSRSSKDEEVNSPHSEPVETLEDEVEDSYPPENDLNLAQIQTHRTHYSERTALGYSLTGINARARQTNESEVGHVFVVEWEGPNDPLKPHNWSFGVRLWATLIVAFVAVAATAASSIDAAVLPQYAAYWGVSEVAGSLATGIKLP
jgi:hypothetical protein